MNLVKPSKKSLIIFLCITVVYLIIIFMKLNICTKAGLICSEKTHYSVPSIFPGSESCQICATSGELTKGYIIIIGLYFVLPLIILYFIVNLIVNRK